MKKIAIFFIVSSIFLFAAEPKIDIKVGCIETKLNETTSIISCPSAEYKVIFELSGSKRAVDEPVIIEKIGEVKPVIINYGNR
ncbi:hypothetical protein [Arcobacter sp. CECT 9188]|uniref:hypothetical protein n=1 Tax=Arcobacter sp. CECT 9188 TaxID=2044505 RepID=UPI000DE9F03A|nr:hypothetical protein [Arcobacter sp. CECT 9188]RBQ27682.1 hypothetical protein CRU88_03155 [Arcobacter sp. CECT 9188]